MGLNRLMTYIHHYSVMQSIFTALKILCSFHCPKNPPFISSSPPTSKNHGYFYCMPFRECHIVGIIQYVAFSDWLLSLSNMHLWFLPISSRLDSSFLFLVCSLSCVWLFATPWRLQYTRLSCPLLSPRVCSNSCPLSHWWCHPTISSSVIPFFSCLQSFLASGSFPMSQLFASGGQSIGASSSASVLPINIQSWFPLGLTGLISL